jgi:pentatricopeptide repeat protein
MRGLLIATLLNLWAPTHAAPPPSPATQARLAFEAGDINAAIALWSQMISNGIEVQDALYNRTQAYLVLRQFPLALSDLNQLELIQKPRARSTTFLLRGIVLNEMQNPNAALREFNLAEKIDRNRLIFANRAVAYQRLGRLQDAEQDLLKAVQVDPSQANGHNLAAIQLALGKLEECIKTSSQVISSYRTFYPAYTVRGICYFRS